jgi:hypothetical protein
MENKQFKDFVQSVAEIKDLSPKKDPNVRLDADAEEKVRIGDEWIEITAKSNPTLGFKFIKLKEQHRACQLGCGDSVVNQVVEKRLAHTPEKHWRTRCANCGCYVSPDGLGFIEGSHQIQAAYLRHFNKLKGVETVEQVIKLNPATQQEYEEIITNNGIIRKYK